MMDISNDTIKTAALSHPHSEPVVVLGQHFHVARPIEKEVFIKYYRQTTEISLICFAPFGLLSDYDDVISEGISEEYVNEYRQWEELIARKLFYAYGFHVDRIAASMHFYIEKTRDPQVVAVIEDAQRLLLTNIKPPAIVELCSMIEPQHIANILETLVRVLRKVFVGIDISNYKDEQVSERCSIDLMRRYITASEVASSKGCLAPEVVVELYETLSIDIGGSIIRLDLLQFTTYLDLFCDTNEISSVLTALNLPTGQTGLQLLRAGRGFVNVVVHPMVSFLFQLDHHPSMTEVQRLTTSENCLEYLHLHMHLKSNLEHEQYDMNLDDLDAILGDISLLGTIPTYLYATLLHDRATFLFKRGEDILALEDCDRIIRLDDRFAKGYSLRAEVLATCGELSSAAVDALAAFLLTGSCDMQLASTAELAAREMCREPAKQEFGSRCVNFADARIPPTPPAADSCPLTAESIALPKEWFLRSYLAGYECLQTAFQLDYWVCYLHALRARLERLPEDVTFDTDLGPAVDPPAHLRDLDSAELRPEDTEAYSLLCILSYLLDKVYFKGDCSVAKDSLDEYLAQRSMEEEGLSIPIEKVSTQAELHDVCYGVDRGLVHQGACQEGVFLDPSTVEGTVDSTGTESKELAAIFSILRSPAAVRITGTQWTAQGHLRTVTVADPYYNIDYDDLNEGVSTEEECSPRVAPQLLARLLNICASIAYACGDTNGALKCLRYSCYLDHRLVDSMLKLGSLLVDTDEIEEAGTVLETAAEQDPLNPYILMHLAELQINNNDFVQSVDLLRRGQNICRGYRGSVGKVSTSSLYADTANIPEELTEIKSQQEKFRITELSANISSLLAVAQFREDPMHPERPLRQLSEAVSLYKSSMNALLCYGEILSQAGDSVGGILAFRKCSILDRSHPLPYVNTARTFNQMGQPELALKHIHHALKLDPTYCMTYVDLSQIYLQQGRTQEALAEIELALAKAKHVSEIRDVLTAKKIATVQLELEERGLYRQIMHT